LRSTGHPYWLSVGFTPVNAPGWRYAAGATRTAQLFGALVGDHRTRRRSQSRAAAVAT
jgi:hypothetical protein